MELELLGLDAVEFGRWKLESRERLQYGRVTPSPDWGEKMGFNQGPRGYSDGPLRWF